ncbi:TetR/AcrR family transcriptional regulator [Kitasatospora sp. NPDC056446]|uniref:TetR/AcrR family transcriptional regulator n=1 Tax=Kitasatospora sp. NPDC056446 TaxID=3345819 RepID=UPI0036AF789E
MTETANSAAGRAAWLAEGLHLLTEHGAPEVTLDRLCTRMGKSKGSFYHHFGSMGGYRKALFAHFEDQGTGSIIEQVEAGGPLTAKDRLRRLLAQVLAGGPETEIAMRAWAKQDPGAEAAQRRVDAARTAYLRELCTEGGHPDPKRMSDLIYLILIGAEHLTPPLAAEDLRDTYEALFTLAWPGFGPLFEGVGKA